MRVKFEAQLERLNVELITMGALCEEVISGAAKALLTAIPACGRPCWPRSGTSTKRSGTSKACV